MTGGEKVLLGFFMKGAVEFGACAPCNDRKGSTQLPTMPIIE